MSVYFSNSGLIDLDVIRVMGVSVKETDSAIGYFGTGLKFAIATLLRTGHKITLDRGGEIYRFTYETSSIRGKTFNRVHMNDEPLPFTTALGKNWEVWQAYRELHSNTLDEAGTITSHPCGGDTVFIVEGDAIQREFVGRGRIFVETKPIVANSQLEVHEGDGSAVFYRGVRAGNLSGSLKFRYNILTTMSLTEDRTFDSQFDVEWTLSRLIPTLAHQGVHSELLEGRDTFDQNLDFTRCSSPSPEFLKAAEACAQNATANRSAAKMVERDLNRKGAFKVAKLSDEDHQKFLNAFPPLLKLGCNLSPEDVEIAETLGPSTMGLYHKAKNQIFLAKSTLDWGQETVVATLYEEWLHKEYRYSDESRELQNFLFQRLVALSLDSQPPEPVKQINEVPF